MRNDRQQGATMIVTLIFLVLISLFAIGAFNSSSVNLRVVGNMQARQEATAAAQAAVEQTISNNAFSQTPEAVAANPINVDIDGDGSTDYTARITPAPKCYRTQPIKSVDLNLSLAADLACIRSGVVQSSGLDTPDAAAVAGNSLCSTSEWNIRAEVVDARTGTKIAVNQGIGVRILETEAANACI